MFVYYFRLGFFGYRVTPQWLGKAKKTVLARHFRGKHLFLFLFTHISHACYYVYNGCLHPCFCNLYPLVESKRYPYYDIIILPRIKYVHSPREM